MYLSEDGFVRTRTVPADPNYALVAMLAYGFQAERDDHHRRTAGGVTTSPRQSELLDRLTKAGRLVLDRVRAWSHPKALGGGTASPA